MQSRTTVANLVSYWLYYAALIAIAFVVSPILVQSLGEERYGAWTLLVSFAGYLSVLDLGLNAALVRLVSRHVARGEREEARAVFSTASMLLAGLGAIAFAVVWLVGPMFLEHFGVADAVPEHAWAVYLIVGADLSAGLALSGLLGNLTGLQQFVRTNTLSIVVSVAKGVTLVALLRAGHGLVAVALVQLGANSIKFLGQYALLRSTPNSPGFALSSCSRAALKELVSYGAYGFLIALALKAMANTDALVIGGLRSASEVTYYAVPASILEHVERLVLAGVAVAAPLVSAREAVGDVERNRRLYVHGALYANLGVLPVLFTLFMVGDDFLRLWMGDELSQRSFTVLRILVCGAGAALPQLVAYGILKGVSRHRALAVALLAQVAANIALSLALVRDYGIAGVAAGTVVPLVVVHLGVLPAYTCRVLGLSTLQFLRDSYAWPLVFLLGLSALAAAAPMTLTSYVQIGSYGIACAGVVALAWCVFVLDGEGRRELRRSVTLLVARVVSLRK